MTHSSRFLISLLIAGLTAAPSWVPVAARADDEELPPLDAPVAPEGSEAPSDSQAEAPAEDLDISETEMSEIPPPADEVESAPVAEGEAPPADETASAETVTGESAATYTYKRIPLYERHQPEWSVMLTGATKALDNQNPYGEGAEFNVRGFSLQWEYQPKYLQAIGVVGIGAGFQLYPTDWSEDGRSSSLADSWSIGGLIRYQARFFREQIVVPTVGFQFESLAYRYGNWQTARTTLQGPVFGGMLLLNWFEKESAGDLYTNYGISRSYLVAELRTLSGGDELIDVSGSSLFFGLRIEY